MLIQDPKRDHLKNPKMVSHKSREGEGNLRKIHHSYKQETINEKII
jgi:hypothetical protein